MTLLPSLPTCWAPVRRAGWLLGRLAALLLLLALGRPEAHPNGPARGGPPPGRPLPPLVLARH